MCTHLPLSIIIMLLKSTGTEKVYIANHTSGWLLYLIKEPLQWSVAVADLIWCWESIQLLCTQPLSIDICLVSSLTHPLALPQLGSMHACLYCLPPQSNNQIHTSKLSLIHTHTCSLTDTFTRLLLILYE